MAAPEETVASPPVAPNTPAADTKPKLPNKELFPRTNAPIQVLESVPAMYPEAAVEAIHAPDEWSTGIATARKGSGMNMLHWLVFT
jgi:hypothetical protein